MLNTKTFMLTDKERMVGRKDLYIFGFAENISESVAISVANNKTIKHNILDISILESDISKIDKYIETLTMGDPQYILGLGMYSGVDKNLIRIETRAKNKFRNGEIDTGLSEIIQINPFLKPNKYAKYAYNMGNSYCNYISYKIAHLIENRQLNSQYTFLHIPKYYNTEVATSEIIQMLSTI